MLALSFAVVWILDSLLFGMGIYRGMLDPNSSTGSFEASIARLRAAATSPSTDVLVLGDSRMYAALDPATAAKQSHGLRFVDAALPGTTPRCWYFSSRAIDSHADRFLAVVIPVDTYADDTSALGSMDGNDREMDLRYIAFEVAPRDIPLLISSFDTLPQQIDDTLNLVLHAPLLGSDVRDLAAHPEQRVTAIASAQSSIAYDPFSAHPRTDPPLTHIDPQEQPKPDARYALYRRMWLGPIVQRYHAAGIPVIFVRIPTRPAHSYPPPAPSGSLAGFARDYGAVFLPQERYVALEQQQLFADADHLNARGSQLFSALLGADVAAALGKH